MGPGGIAQSGPVDVQTVGADYPLPQVCLTAAPVAANGTLLADLSLKACRVRERRRRQVTR